MHSSYRFEEDSYVSQTENGLQLGPCDRRSTLFVSLGLGSIDAGFAGVVAELWRRRETGCLKVVAQGIQTEVQLEQGTPVSVRGGAFEDTLGRLLVRMGRLTETQLSEAIDALLVDPSPNRRIGDVFVDYGFLTTGEVEEALRLQSRQKLLTCFSWPEISWEFDPSARLSASEFRFRWDVPTLIADGIRQHYGHHRIGRLLETLSSRLPRLRDAVHSAARDLKLDPDDRHAVAEEAGERLHRFVSRLRGFDEDVLVPHLVAAIAYDSISLGIGPEGHHTQDTRSERRPSVGRRRTKGATSEFLTLWAKASFKEGSRLYRTNARAALVHFRKAFELRPDVKEYELMVQFVEFLLEEEHAGGSQLAAEARQRATTALR